jgi:hypothetical protein
MSSALGRWLDERVPSSSPWCHLWAHWSAPWTSSLSHHSYCDLVVAWWRVVSSRRSLLPPTQMSSRECRQRTTELHLSHRWSSKPCIAREHSWPLLALGTWELELLVKEKRNAWSLVWGEEKLGSSLYRCSGFYWEGSELDTAMNVIHIWSRRYNRR